MPISAIKTLVSGEVVDASKSVVSKAKNKDVKKTSNR